MMEWSNKIHSYALNLREKTNEGNFFHRNLIPFMIYCILLISAGVMYMLGWQSGFYFTFFIMAIMIIRDLFVYLRNGVMKLWKKKKY